MHVGKSKVKCELYLKFFTYMRKSTKNFVHTLITQKQNAITEVFTGCYLSETLILTSINPKYDIVI